MKKLTVILTSLVLLASCYKDEVRIPTPTSQSDLDTAEFTIIGGGFNETINTDYAYHLVFSNPPTGEEGSRIRINGELPSLEIIIDDYSNNTYTIDGYNNRAYLFTDTYIGDAISGTVTIIEHTGTMYFKGAFDITFRDNSINPTDTIVVQGSYTVEH